MTEFESGILMKDMDFLEQLGIIRNDDKTVSSYSDVPRIFIMKTSEDGLSEEMADPGKLGIGIGSPEFWKQAQLGNVFAFPAGDDRPVQLQVDCRNGKSPKVSYSKPLSASDFPPPPEPRKPNLWHKMWSWASKNYAKICNDYDTWESKCRMNYNNCLLNSSLRTGSGKLETEKRDAKRVKDYTVETERRKKNAEALDVAKKREKWKEKGLEIVKDIYKPVPEQHAELTFKRSIPGVIDNEDHTEKLYTKEEFDKLKPYKDLNLENIKIGGKSVSEMEFCELAMMAGCQGKHSINNPLMTSQDPCMAQVFTDIVGLSKEEAKVAMAMSFDNVVNKDILEESYRQGAGQAFESMVVPGREDAKNALEKYRPDDIESKKDLAKLLAFGVWRVNRSISTLGGRPSDNVQNYYRMSKCLTDLIDRDKDLKKLAVEAGMTEEDYKRVKNLHVIDKMHTGALKAQQKLLTSALKNEPLPKEEKRQVLRDILKSSLVENTLHQEVETAKAPKADEALEKMMANSYETPRLKQLDENATPEEIQKDKENRALYNDYKKGKMAPGGKVWKEKVYNYQYPLIEYFKEGPKTILNLGDPKKTASLDKMVDKIIDTDGLMNLPEDRLAEKIREDEYMLGGIVNKGNLAAQAIKAEQKLNEQAEPEMDKIKEENGVQHNALNAG
ncbi:MAG: hypothetical protein IKN24_03050 [Lachnospiraceae bacterium]|nr:hypothetical protein [Lachnospiraceae bacterium]